MSTSEKKYWQKEAKEMFYHGYNNYMQHAFPWDELKPLSCEGRRWYDRKRGDIDDVLGGYSLTLVDSLDMLAIIGDREEFKRAIQLVIDTVSFDRDVIVSVFEATIRVIGGLLSAHMLASSEYVGLLTEEEYHGELLNLAVDLGQRLLPAFNTPTGLPVHRVNLKYGLHSNSTTDEEKKYPPKRHDFSEQDTRTCPAAAGSLLLEFSYLSRLSGLSIFEETAEYAVLHLYDKRSKLNLLGASIDVFSGRWIHAHMSIGAGIDSYLEYLLKFHVVSGDQTYWKRFLSMYDAVEQHLQIPNTDVHIEVNMDRGNTGVHSLRVSALQAFWPGLQVLKGDVTRAVQSHTQLFSLWEKYSAMPELVDLAHVLDEDQFIISWAKAAPLRPELVESTYYLYQATRDEKYLKIGRKLLLDMKKYSRVKCGYAAIADIHSMTVEDRMDSFFLSETVKYLYLLFQDSPDVVVSQMSYPNATTGVTRIVKSSEVIFTTEGHVFLTSRDLFPRLDNSDRRNSNTSSSECENLHFLQAKNPKHLNPSSTFNKLWGKQTAGKFPAKEIAVAFAINHKSHIENHHIHTAIGAPANFGPSLEMSSVQSQLLNTPLIGLYAHELLGDACGSGQINKNLPLINDSVINDIAGKVVIIPRGNCSFAQKAITLQELGAIAVIVVNTIEPQIKNSLHISQRIRKYFMTDDGSGLAREVKIPLVMIQQNDFAVLQDFVAAEVEENPTYEIQVSLSMWLD